MNFRASHSLLNDTDEDELSDFGSDETEGEDDIDSEEDPFEVSTTNPWEYDDRDDF